MLPVLQKRLSVLRSENSLPQASNSQPSAVRPALLAWAALQQPAEELAGYASPPEGRLQLPESPASPPAERSSRARQQPWEHQSILTMAASQSPGPAAREKQWPESASESRAQSVAPGVAREQFSVEGASILPEPRRHGAAGAALTGVPADAGDSLKACPPKDWRRARKRSALQLQLPPRSLWDAAAVQPSRHEAFPAFRAVLSAAVWRAKHLPAGKCATNQSSASVRPLPPSQAHSTRTFHHGPGRRAHAWPRLPQPSWNAFSSL